MSRTDEPPLQALPYLPPSQDFWPVVLRVLSTVATIYAGLILFAFAAQIGMTFAGSRTFTSLSFDFSNGRTALGSVAQLAVGAGAVVILCGSIGRQTDRPAARTLLLVGLGIVLGAELLTWAFRMLMIFGGGSPFPRSYGAVGTMMYVAYTLGYTLSRSLLPLAMIWVLRRPVIRQQYDGTVSFG